jgi:hypothetical protein
MRHSLLDTATLSRSLSLTHTLSLSLVVLPTDTATTNTITNTTEMLDLLSQCVLLSCVHVALPIHRPCVFIHLLVS